jgi:multiple antibiotic resistance protein
MATSELISVTIIFFLIMLLIAYVALLGYLFFGRYVLDILNLSQEAIAISGGIILFIIAIRMIFPTQHGLFGPGSEGEPLIVPLAIPAVAGPSIMAVLMLMSTNQPLMLLFACITLAWFLTAVILLASTPLNRMLGRRGLMAVERLMGMLLVMMSVQMLLNAYTAIGEL